MHEDSPCDALPTVDAPGATLRLHAWRAGHAGQFGHPCLNCGVTIEGPFCLACGQTAMKTERSVGELLLEAAESLFHADGKLLRTLQRLALHPAGLTRDYLEGKRAAQSAPLRLFLVVCLLYFLLGDLHALLHPAPPWFVSDRPGETIDIRASGLPITNAIAKWFNPRFAFAISHQEDFRASIEARFHSLAVLFLPLSTLILALLFARQRRYLVDHAIFSMHSLSFMGILLSAILALDLLLAPLGLTTGFLLVLVPVHLFMHLRGFYATSIAGTLARMLALALLSMAAVALLLFGDFAFALNGIGIETH